MGGGDGEGETGGGENGDIGREDIGRRGEEGEEGAGKRESVRDCIVCRYGHEWVYKHTINS